MPNLASGLHILLTEERRKREPGLTAVTGNWLVAVPTRLARQKHSSLPRCLSPLEWVGFALAPGSRVTPLFWATCKLKRTKTQGRCEAHL